jgi:hypothetical protein
MRGLLRPVEGGGRKDPRWSEWGIGSGTRSPATGEDRGGCVPELSERSRISEAVSRMGVEW